MAYSRKAGDGKSTSESSTSRGKARQTILQKSRFPLIKADSDFKKRADKDFKKLTLTFETHNVQKNIKREEITQLTGSDREVLFTGTRDKVEVEPQEYISSIPRHLMKYLRRDHKFCSSKPLARLTNIVFIGKTGHGKSATANTVMGKSRFKSSLQAASLTQNLHCEEIEITGRKYRLIDTPGLFDTVNGPENVTDELCKAVHTCVSGVDAFIYVHNVSVRFSQEEQCTMNQITGLFGQGFYKYCGLVLTHGENVVRYGDLDQYLSHGMNSQLSEFLKKINHRVVAINNICDGKEERRFMQRAILDLVEIMQDESEYTMYSNELFEEARIKREEADKLERERELQKRADDAKEIADIYQEVEEYALYVAADYFERHIDRYEFSRDQKHGYQKAIRFVYVEVKKKFQAANYESAREILLQVSIVRGKDIFKLLSTNAVYKAANEFNEKGRLEEQHKRIKSEKDQIERHCSEKEAQIKHLQHAISLLQEKNEKGERSQNEKERDLEFHKAEYEESYARQLKENRENERLKMENDAMKRKQSKSEFDAENQSNILSKRHTEEQRRLREEHQRESQKQREELDRQKQDLEAKLKKQQEEHAREVAQVELLNKELKNMETLKKQNQILMEEQERQIKL